MGWRAPLAALHLPQAGQGQMGGARFRASLLPRRQQDQRRPHARARLVGGAPLDIGSVERRRGPLLADGYTMTNANKTSVAPLFGEAMTGALQWRLLVVWVVGLLVPTAVMAMPLW